MKSNNKLILTLFISALILSIGTIYYINLTEKTTTKRGGLYYSEKLLLPENNITPSVNLENFNSTKTRRNSSQYDQLSYTVPSSNSSVLNSINKSSSLSLTQAISKNSTYTGQLLSKNEDNIYSTSSSTSSLGLLSYRSSGTGTTSENTGSIVGINSANPPTFVPFTPQPNPDVILVDPMPDTKMILLPVGEGWWIILIMAIGYIGYKRWKI